MIVSADFLYDTRRRGSRWPAMVRESIGAPRADAATYSGGASATADAISAPAPPEPSNDDDELFQLGERIAELAARINAAESRMMMLIADFDRRGGWKDGFGSCAEWLAWRIGIKIGPARERVRTARALERLPQTADALREGSISYAKVRALTRVATPEHEAELLEFARAGSAAKLEQTVRMWRRLSRDAELTAEQTRHGSRAFSVFVDGDGMYVVKGRLEPEAGAVLMRAVEAASDALFRREHGADDARPETTHPRSRSSVGRMRWDCSRSGRWRRGSEVASFAAPAAVRMSRTALRSPNRMQRFGQEWLERRETDRRMRRTPNLASSPAPARSATRSWSTATPRVCQPKASPDARIWMESAFPRKRRGAWRAMRRWWPWSMRRTARR